MEEDIPRVRIIILGNSGVGKTSLIDHYSNGRYDYSSVVISTIGLDFHTKNLIINGRNIKLQLWDTYGQERFRALQISYYRRAEGILILYDVSDRASFEAIPALVQTADDILKTLNAHADKIIVGNKIDKEAERQVTYDEGLALANSLNLPFIETSAKTGQNVSEAYEHLATTIVERKTVDWQSESANKKLESTKTKSNSKQSCY